MGIELRDAGGNMIGKFTITKNGRTGWPTAIEYRDRYYYYDCRSTEGRAVYVEDTAPVLIPYDFKGD